MMVTIASPNTTQCEFKFKPCHHGWIALHPNPRGVIQFIGSAAPSGAFPTVAYHYCLKSLFKSGYTVVVLPFRFTFDHWSIALDLLDKHYVMRRSMLAAVVAQGHDPAIYLDPSSYTWIGHGLGCKYVALLEVLSAPMDVLSNHLNHLYEAGQEPLQARQLKRIQQGLAVADRSVRSLEKCIHELVGQTIDYGRPSIMHQASVLLAPMITDLDAAVPSRPLRQVVSQLMTVYPTVEQTHGLIERSQLFHLTGLIQFARDHVAADTCQQLMYAQPHIRRRLLKGNHLEPVGIQLGQLIVDFNPLDKLVQPLQCRDLEFQVLALLNRLREQPNTTAGHSDTMNKIKPARRRAMAA